MEGAGILFIVLGIMTFIISLILPMSESNSSVINISLIVGKMIVFLSAGVSILFGTIIMCSAKILIYLSLIRSDIQSMLAPEHKIDKLNQDAK